MADEDDYFHKRDQEAKAKLKAEKLAAQAASDTVARAELHRNKCGKCGSDMTTRVFRGVEIEICDQCGAVLLDPGELEQLAGQDSTDVFSSFFSMFGGKKSS